MSDISYFKEWIQDNWKYTRGHGLPYNPYVTHQIDGLSSTQPTPNSKEHQVPMYNQNKLLLLCH